ncbi:MAG: hypothetical protein MJ220_01800 [Bacilli bacterium]|nr:hypothetical protein [Bacilli bacterium]
MLLNGILASSTEWNFSMANYGAVWGGLVQIGLVVISLFLGNMLRNLIPFLRKSLIPSALIGGTILLIISIICNQLGFHLVDKQFMQVLTYHGLGIGFVAMTLKTSKATTKAGKIKVVETGLLTGGTYMLQALLGLGITIILFLAGSGFYASGLILPLGYGQGPGNALAWDINYTNDYPTMFSGNGSFGLSIASIGFIVASVVGVAFINIKRKSGKITTVGEIKEQEEIYAESGEIPSSESIDKFSVQVGLVAIAYALSFGFMVLLGLISEFTNNLAWGFNFLWGVFAAMLVKLVLKLLMKGKLVKRNYINNYQMDRISGFCFDVMVVAGVAAIEIKDVMNYILPIILLCLVGALASYVYIRFVTKHCFKGYEHEAFVMHFATYTGTASNGMILLREVDPNLETPVANLYVMSQVIAMVSAAPLLLLLGFAGKSLTNSLIALGVFAVLFIAYTLFLFRKLIFKKKKAEPEVVNE